MIIGITGTLGAGKGTIVEYLVEHYHFFHISARAVWTEELKKRGLPIDRDHMTALANELRREHGAAYFVEQALVLAKGHHNVIIESIRTSQEAQLLKSHGGVLIAVDAEVRTRYERIISRASELDTVSFEDFVRQEQAEMRSDDPHKQNLSAVIALADYAIENNGTPEELRVRIADVCKKIGL